MADSKAVIGVVGAGVSARCLLELEEAARAQKNIIVMTYAEYFPQLSGIGFANLVQVDPSNPAPGEFQVVDYLKRMDLERSSRMALVGLGTLAVGLLVIAAAADKHP